MSDFGLIRALRLGGVADKRNPFVPGANWFGILVYVEAIIQSPLRERISAN